MNCQYCTWTLAFRVNLTFDLPEMWYGVFLWAVVSSLLFHLPAALLSLATLRQHKIARFMPIAIFLMGIVGPLCGGVLTSKGLRWPLSTAIVTPTEASHDANKVMLPCFAVCEGAAIAGVYKAAGKRMISLEALVFGVGQSFCVLVISFLRVLATL